MKKILILLVLLYTAITVMAQSNNDSISFTHITTTDFMEAISGGKISWSTMSRPKPIKCPKVDGNCGGFWNGIGNFFAGLGGAFWSGVKYVLASMFDGEGGGAGGGGFVSINLFNFPGAYGPPSFVPPGGSGGGGSATTNTTNPLGNTTIPPPVKPAVDDEIPDSTASLKKDCAGVKGGTAYRDYCDSCVGGTTGKTACCPTDSTFSLTKAVIKNMYPNSNPSRSDSVAKYINLYGQDYGITTRLRLAHLLAQMMAETSGFYTTIESWNYKTKKVLFENFKDRKKINDSNYHYYLNCQCLFDMYYAGDGKNHTNGDSTTHDGSRYRGRGAIQLTHRDSYYRFTKYYRNKYSDNSVDFEADPDLIITNMKFFVLSALWEFGVDKSQQGNVYNALKDADNDNIKKVSFGVNGGYNLFKERKEALAAIKKILCL
ncbi:MAG TPA: hypothetical protein PKI98_06975 [Chitinophagaceae bacterium]|nr:hypothetical protein [Chitinophagaceae bacterium]